MPNSTTSRIRSVFGSTSSAMLLCGTAMFAVCQQRVARLVTSIPVCSQPGCAARLITFAFAKLWALSIARDLLSQAIGGAVAKHASAAMLLAITDTVQRSAFKACPLRQANIRRGPKTATRCRTLVILWAAGDLEELPQQNTTAPYDSSICRVCMKCSSCVSASQNRSDETRQSSPTSRSGQGLPVAGSRAPSNSASR